MPYDLLDAARGAWDDAIAVGSEHGFRNGQATVLAPTGTIGFMMDCDTTGIEPDIALIKYKRLVGGGMIKIVNNTIDEALARLGYDDDQRKSIIEYVDREETIEGAPGLKNEHLPVFDCAFRAANGTRSIHYMGHIRMMAAAQPFLSGAISKTVNLPADATVEDVENAYMESWKLGPQGDRRLPRRLQAHPAAVDQQGRPGHWQVGGGDGGGGRRGACRWWRSRPRGPPAAVRRKLPDERHSFTHKFSIAGHEGYIHVGLYESGEPGEIFVRMAKEGSTISGLMDSFATAISLALQHGVPLQAAGRQVLAHPLRAVRASPATRRSRAPRRSWTTSSAGWARSSCKDEEAVAEQRHRRQRRSEADRRGGRDRQHRRPAVDARSPARHRGGGGDARNGQANGNGQRQRQRQRQRERQRGNGQLQLHRPQRRPDLRRMRQHHDPQRQLPQMHQLRHHQRLQLS